MLAKKRKSCDKNIKKAELIYQKVRYIESTWYIESIIHVYVWFGQVKNGRLYLRYGEQLWENHSKMSQNSSRQKAFAILLLKLSHEFCDLTQKLRKTLENFDFVILLFLLSSSSFFFIMRNSKTIGRIYKPSTCQTNTLRWLFLIRSSCKPLTVSYNPKRCIIVAFLDTI